MLLGVALLREGSAPRLPVGILSLGFGLIGLAGLGGLALGHDFGLGSGGVERVMPPILFPLWIAGAMGAWVFSARRRKSAVTAADPA